MANGVVRVPEPRNEPVSEFRPGSSERKALEAELAALARKTLEITPVIAGRRIRTGATAQAVMPHDHRHVLATWHKAGRREVARAIAAAREAHAPWSRMPWE